jgi:hypothetical protein
MKMIYVNLGRSRGTLSVSKKEDQNAISRSFDAMLPLSQLTIMASYLMSPTEGRENKTKQNTSRTA